jgi:GTP pyrophosphokinase
MHLARRAHEGQYRKGTSTPYIAHPLAVAALALHYGADDDVASAAVLHDTVEDGGGRPMLERIRWGIGERVASIVDGCTDAYGAPSGPGRSASALRRAPPSLPNATKLVIACDKLDNLRATHDDLRTQGRSTFEKFSAPPLGCTGTTTNASARSRRRSRSARRAARRRSCARSIPGSPDGARGVRHSRAWSRPRRTARASSSSRPAGRSQARARRRRRPSVTRARRSAPTR